MPTASVPRATVPAPRRRAVRVRGILAGSRRPPASEPVLHRYRSTASANFGGCDDPPTWVEKPFTDKENDPWIEKVTVRFDGTTTDADGDLVPTGEVMASYHSNKAALPALSGIPIVGGKASEGLTDAGKQRATRPSMRGASHPAPSPACI